MPALLYLIMTTVSVNMTHEIACIFSASVTIITLCVSTALRRDTRPTMALCRRLALAVIITRVAILQPLRSAYTITTEVIINQLWFRIRNMDRIVTRKTGRVILYLFIRIVLVRKDICRLRNRRLQLIHMRRYQLAVLVIELFDNRFRSLCRRSRRA